MDNNDIFKDDKIDKKEEGLLDKVFSKPKKDKIDLNYFMCSSQKRGNVEVTGIKPEIVRIFVNEKDRGSSFELFFLLSFIRHAGMDYQLVRTRAEHLLNCSKSLISRQTSSFISEHQSAQIPRFFECSNDYFGEPRRNERSVHL